MIDNDKPKGIEMGPIGLPTCFYCGQLEGGMHLIGRDGRRDICATCLIKAFDKVLGEPK